jgi:cystathionine beta-synthase
MSDKQSKEKMDILRAVGAKVVVCPTDVEPTDPRSYYSVSRRLAEETPNSCKPIRQSFQYDCTP